jgi:hypothetical protein
MRLQVTSITAQTRPESNEASVIFVSLSGGMSHLDSLDPKPEAPREVRGEFGVIDTAVSGVQLCEYLPQLAASLDRFTILRAVAHRQTDHLLARRALLTGEQFATDKTPAIGAILASHAGWRMPPAYVSIPGLPPNAGELGAACEAADVLGDVGHLLQAGPQGGEMNSAQFQRRVGLLDEMMRRSPRSDIRSQALSDRKISYDRAIEMLGSQTLVQALELNSEPDATRDRYGRDSWGDHLLLARRLVEAGSRFVIATLGGWDTHSHNFKTLREQLPRLDRSLMALIDDLDARNRLGTTTVVVTGEFGRTPNINMNAGRDHWPRAMSVLWAGGGSQGGRVIGCTDATGAEPTDARLTPGDLAYTLLERLGVDAHNIASPSGRVYLPDARRIDALFA